MICPACNAKYTDTLKFCHKDGTVLVPDGDPVGHGEGEILADRYRIVRLLGVGGMGEVYEAEHIYIEKKVALKLLRPEVTSNAEAVTRFHQEALAASTIGHDNIVAIDDFGRLSDGSVYLTMEYLAGPALSDTMLEGGLTADRALRLITQICCGLAAAHAKGVIHRDMKPENVQLVTDMDGVEVAKILDFGIAKVLTAGSGQNLTRTGAIFGTPHYMSPEQAMGRQLDHRTDIYSVGVMMYELFTGTVPFKAESFMGILTQHITTLPTPPSEVAPDQQIPPEIARIIMTAMNKDPAERYPSMVTMLEDLETARQTVPAFQMPAATPPRPLPHNTAARSPGSVPATARGIGGPRGSGATPSFGTRAAAGPPTSSDLLTTSGSDPRTGPLADASGGAGNRKVVAITVVLVIALVGGAVAALFSLGGKESKKSKKKVAQVGMTANRVDPGLAPPPKLGTGQRAVMKMYRAYALDARADGCLDSKSQTHHPDGNHAVVACHYGAMITVRTRKEYPSCVVRADNVARRLNESTKLMQHGKGTIDIEYARGLPVLYIKSTDGTHRQKLLTVTKNDVGGYQLRSCKCRGHRRGCRDKEVTAYLVAKWWVDILMDHMDAMSRNVRPTRSTDTLCGIALAKMYTCARRAHRSGKIPMSAFRRCLAAGGSRMKEHLTMAARVLPKERCPGKTLSPGGPRGH